jgi:hypothetical protein
MLTIVAFVIGMCVGTTQLLVYRHLVWSKKQLHALNLAIAHIVKDKIFIDHKNMQNLPKNAKKLLKDN